MLCNFFGCHCDILSCLSCSFCSLFNCLCGFLFHLHELLGNDLFCSCELFLDLGQLISRHLGDLLAQFIDIDASLVHILLEAALEILAHFLALLNGKLALLDEFANDLLAFLCSYSCCTDTCEKEFLNSITKLVICHFILLIIMGLPHSLLSIYSTIAVFVSLFFYSILKSVFLVTD